MKTLKFIPLLLMMLLAIACEENKAQEVTDESRRLAMADTETEEINSMMGKWKQAWDSNNGKSLQDLAADDAVLLFFGEGKKGDSLKNWLKETSLWMKDLDNKRLVRQASDRIAYEAGEFTHGTKENDTVKFEGSYVIIWEKIDSLVDWKIKLLDISPRVQMEMPAVTENMNSGEANAIPSGK